MAGDTAPRIPYIPAMSGEHLILKAIAAIFFRERRASVRWAQMRRIACGGCDARFWVLATRQVDVTSHGLRLLTSEESTELKAFTEARKSATKEAESPSGGMVSCPDCEWVSPGVRVKAWTRAVLLALIPTMIAGVFIVVIVGKAIGLRGGAFAAISIGSVLGLWGLSAWILRKLICRLPGGLAMPRYPARSPAWVNNLLVTCDGEVVSPEESWLRQEGISTPSHGLILAPPVDL
jgi:hypothetical protein